MVRTKQTQHGGSSQRPASMQVAVQGDQPEADQDILERSQFENIDEEDWPDVHNPVHTTAQQAAQTSKSTCETDEGSKAVGKPTPIIDPPQPPAQDPSSCPPQPPPQPPPQAPTDDPPQPKASTRIPLKILKRKKIQPL